jgi:hypothetical protein
MVVMWSRYKVRGRGVSRVAFDILPLGGQQAFIGLGLEGFRKRAELVESCGVILIHSLGGRIFQISVFADEPPAFLRIPQALGHLADLQVGIVRGGVEDVIRERYGGVEFAHSGDRSSF